jgi:hypothetical protein
LYSDLENATSEEEKIEAYNSYIKGMALIEYALAKYAMAGNKLLPITEKNEYLPLNGEDITLEFIDFMSDRLKTGATPKQALNDAFMNIIYPQRNGVIQSQVGPTETGWLFFSGVDSASGLRLVTADTGSEPGSWCIGRGTRWGRNYLSSKNMSVYVQNGKSLVASLDDLSDGQPTEWFGLGPRQSVLPSHKYLLEEHPNLIQAPVVVLSPEEQLEADKKEEELNEKKEGYNLAERVLSEAAKGDVRALSIVYDVRTSKYSRTPVTSALSSTLSNVDNNTAVERLTGFSSEMFEAFSLARDETDQAINNLTVADVIPELAALEDYNNNIIFEVSVINTSLLANPNNPDTQMALAPIVKLINAYSLENELPLRGDINGIIKRYIISNGTYSTGRGYSSSFINYLESLLDAAGGERRDQLGEALSQAGNLTANEYRQRLSDYADKFSSDKEAAFGPLRDWSWSLPQESFVATFSASTTPVEAYDLSLSYHMPGHPSVYGTSDGFTVSSIVNRIREQNNIPDDKSLYTLKREKQDEIKKLGKYEFIARARATVPLEKLKAIPKNYYKPGSQWEKEIENVPYDIPGVSAMLEGRETTGEDGEAPRILASKKVILPKVKDALLRIKRSNSATEMGNAVGDLITANNFEDVKEQLGDLVDYLDSKRIAGMLPNLTTYQITSSLGKSIPHLAEVTAAVQHMDVMRNKMLANVANKSDRWTEFNHKFPKYGMLLNDVMHFARLQRIDFSAYTSLNSALAKDPILAAAKKNRDKATKAQARASYQGQINDRIASLTQGFKLWNELGSVDNGEGHNIFSLIKNHYQEMFNLQRAILDERVANSKVPGDINDASTPKGRLMAAIRKTYETVEEEGGVYFPYMRYGNYWLRVGKGEGKEFYMFESEYQRNRMLRKRVKELQAAGDTRNKDDLLEAGDLAIGNRIDDSRDDAAASDELLKGVFKAIDTQKAVDKDALKDAVYQLYLMTMPEQAFRKKYIHAKGTTGFNPDALRNFVRASYTSANQLSKLKYGPEIRNSIEAARASLAGNPKEYKLDMVVSEVEKRVELEFSPPDEDSTLVKAVNGFNQFVFLWRLTSPRAALVNLTALPNFGLPTLISEFGEKEATVGMAKFAKVWEHTAVITPDGKFTPISVGFSNHVQESPVLKQAFEEAVDREITEVTRTHDLLALARVPSAQYRSKVSRGYAFGIKAAGYLFHHTERLNRKSCL